MQHEEVLLVQRSNAEFGSIKKVVENKERDELDKMIKSIEAELNEVKPP